MSETLVPIALYVTLAAVVVSVTKIISDGRTRRRLIETNATPEVIRAITKIRPADLGLYEALKLGIVFAAIGIALVVVQYIPFRPTEPIVYGVITLFGAAGFMVYYAAGRRIARRMRMRAEP